MDFLYSLLVWFMGCVAAVLFLVQVFMVVLFGIPFTLKLRRMGILKGPSNLKVYTLALIVLPTLFALATWGTLTLFPGRWLAYIFGAVVPVMLSIFSVANNPGKIFEYVYHREEDIDREKLAEFLPQDTGEFDK